MHIKTKSWRVPYSGKLIKYICRGALTVEDGGFSLFLNVSFPSIGGLMKDFDAIQNKIAENKYLKVFFHHHMLNFSPEDNSILNVEILEDLTRKYIELRGFDKTLSFAQVHKGKNGGFHVHIMAANSKLGPQTKSLRIDLIKYKSIQREMEKYQLEHYGLTNSIVYLKKPIQQTRDIVKEEQNRRKENEYHAKKRLSNKELIKDELKNLLSNLISRSTTYDDFLDNIMQSSGLEIYQYRKKTNGVIYKGYKFRFRTLGLQTQIEVLHRNEILEVTKLKLERLEELQNKKSKEIKLHLGKNQ